MSPDDPRHGTPPGRRAHRRAGQPVCERCKEANALYQRRSRKIRALYGDRTVPALGSIRRIHALQRIGWSLPAISKYADIPHKQLWQITLQERVTMHVANRVSAAYEVLSMSLPPTETKGQRISAAKVRAHAKQSEWPPPLAYDNIDDPDEQPTAWQYTEVDLRNVYAGRDIDPVVVMRLLEGDRTVKANTAERVEALAQWRADGGSERELCLIHGWKTGRYGRLRLVEEAS